MELAYWADTGESEAIFQALFHDKADLQLFFVYLGLQHYAWAYFSTL